MSPPVALHPVLASVGPCLLFTVAPLASPPDFDLIDVRRPSKKSVIAVLQSESGQLLLATHCHIATHSHLPQCAVSCTQWFPRHVIRHGLRSSCCQFGQNRQYHRLQCARGATNGGHCCTWCCCWCCPHSCAYCASRQQRHAPSLRLLVCAQIAATGGDCVRRANVLGTFRPLLCHCHLPVRAVQPRLLPFHLPHVLLGLAHAASLQGAEEAARLWLATTPEDASPNPR